MDGSSNAIIAIPMTAIFGHENSSARTEKVNAIRNSMGPSTTSNFVATPSSLKSDSMTDPLFGLQPSHSRGERYNLVGRRLDRLHVLVGEAEMVADLVDQDMGDDRRQAFGMIGPIGEDRLAVEPDHVGHRAGQLLAEGQANALKQPQQVVAAANRHVVKNVPAREVLDPDHQALAQGAEMGGKPGKGPCRQALDVGKRYSLSAPGPRIVELPFHRSYLGQGTAQSH